MIHRGQSFSAQLAHTTVDTVEIKGGILCIYPVRQLLLKAKYPVSARFMLFLESHCEHHGRFYS